MLLDEHRKHLRESTLTDDAIAMMGVWSETEPSRVAAVLSACRSLLAFPYHGHNGDCRYKCFDPVETVGGTIRYYQSPGSHNHLYVLPPVLERLNDPSVALHFCEGEKKTAALVQRGYCAVGISGLWNWKETDTWEGIAELQLIPLVRREAIIDPDSDIWVQRRIDLQKAVYSFAKYLETCGAHPNVLVIPPDGTKKLGVDDYFALGHTNEEFDQLQRLTLKDLPLAQHKKWYIEWKAFREDY